MTRIVYRDYCYWYRDCQWYIMIPTVTVTYHDTASGNHDHWHGGTIVVYDLYHLRLDSCQRTMSYVRRTTLAWYNTDVAHDVVRHGGASARTTSYQYDVVLVRGARTTLI
jgi:hypothetical protein